MNRYDKLFDYRLAMKHDIDPIMQFIKNEWAEDHILANDKELFQWQYGKQDSDEIHCLLMLTKEGEIAGIIGFTPTSEDIEKRYICPSINKVKSGLSIPMSGVELIRRYRQMLPAKGFYASGVNPKTLIPVVDRIFHDSVGVMKQYYKLNKHIDSFKIADVKQRKVQETVCSDINLTLIHETQFDDLKSNWDFESRYPYQAYKSDAYVKWRFFNHPIYQYQVYGIREYGISKYRAVLIGREIEAFGRKVFKIVDYLGDLYYFSLIGKQIDELIVEKCYEYVDFTVSFSPNLCIEKAGFVLREGNYNVIPTYFEPFIRENIDTWFENTDDSIVIFKADGDQDRPNYRTCPINRADLR